MATIPAPEAQAPVNHFGRMLGALFSPKQTFEDIARRPSWLAPVILLTIINVALIAVFTQRVGWERFMQQQFEQSPRAAQMTPQQRAQAVERAASFAKVGGYIGAVVGFSILTLVIAAVLMGAFKLIAGAKIGYSNSAGVVSHALMPLGLASLLGMVILYLKDPDTVNLENLVGSNVGAVLASDSPRWLTKLGTSLDLFSFWTMVLLAVGFSAADPKRVTLGKALGVVIALWAIYVLAKVGWAAAFS